MPIVRHAHIKPHLHIRHANISRGNMDMTTGPFFSKIMRYTIPIILTSLLQLLFNAADLIVVGQVCGDLYLGAVGATGSLVSLNVNFFIGLSIGAGVCIAQSVGSGDDDAIQKALHTTVMTALCSGALLTVVGTLGARTFLAWMDTPPEVIDLSATYLRIYFSGIIPILLYNYCAAILRAVGDTKSPFIYLSLAGVLNVVMNLIFVLAFDMNVDGVALATVLSQVFACGMILSKLMRRKDACRLRLKKLRFHREQLGRVLGIGIPAGLQSSMFAISNVLIQSSINSFGAVAVSGVAAAGNIENFVYVTMHAFNQTATNFVGQNVGAKKYDNIPKIMKICLGCVVAFGLGLGILINLNANTILSVYLTDAPEFAYKAARVRLLVVCLFYFLCGSMDVVTGTLRGMGCSLPPMLITVVGVCGLRIAYIFTLFRLPMFHSLQSLFASYPISWILTFFAEVICYAVVRKRMKRDNAELPAQE